MNKKIIVLGLVGILIIISLSFDNVVAQSVVTLSGHIEDQNGNPVRTNVRVGSTETVTDSNGDYSLNILAGTHTMELSAFGVQPNAPNSYHIHKDLTITENTIQDVVFSFVTLSGTVRDTIGQSVLGVTIAARTDNTIVVDGFTGSATGSDVSDASGFYSAILFPTSVGHFTITPPPTVFPQFQLPGIDVFSDTTFDIIINVILGTTSEALQFMIDNINGLGLSNGIEKSLTKSLEQSIKLLEDNNATNDGKVCLKLDKFIKKVESQRGKSLSEEEANFLINGAELLKDKQNCL